MRQAHAPAFAGFLSRLNLEARPQTALRTEVLAWLHTLSADASKLQTVFRIAAESWESEAVLITYRAMRAASE